MYISHEGKEHSLFDLLGGLNAQEVELAWLNAEDYQEVWNNVCNLMPYRVAECLIHAMECEYQRDQHNSGNVARSNDYMLEMLNGRDHSVMSNDEQGCR